MASDPEKFDEFRSKVESLIDQAPVGEENKEFIAKNIFGEAFAEMEGVVDESRPPRLYIFGKSGSGKSSLINALAGKEVAEVGDFEPTTSDSVLYNIPFEDRYASWDVVDSRGMFESIPADGEAPQDTVDSVKQDLEQYRPDVLVHVMTKDQIRAGEKDFAAVQKLRDEISPFPPIIYCLNKVDGVKSIDNDWPPEEDAILAGDIKEYLDTATRVLDEKRDGDVLLEQNKKPFKNNQPLYGYTFDSEEYLGIFPTVVEKEEHYWNVDTLSEFIGDSLPMEAKLQFFQAQRREQLMRDMSRDMTNRFATQATAIGGAPTPVADIAVLTPMQFALVGLIGSFSCRELEWATVQDYLSAMGGTTLAGFGARKLVRSIGQVVPGVGQVVSAAVAGGMTWAIGRSAEEYFFNDNVVKPAEFIQKGKDRFS